MVALKAAPGRDIVAFGGVTLVKPLVEHGLVDEYWLKVVPTAIGGGRPLFRERASSRLLDSLAWPSGTPTLRYAAA